MGPTPGRKQMKNRRIYVRAADGSLESLVEEGFALEDDLQSLLEDHPELLAGDQMNESEPRRWLLISREKSVPGEESGPGRWSLDHLFLDQDGIPTLVEVKRSTDTRIRREVVGQMLDYAANGMAYWPVEKLRSDFEAHYPDHQERIYALLEDDADIDAFWANVKTNLKAGRIRLLFVSDQIPNELRRIIEFLNEQMDPAEVLAVAIRQYVGGSLQTLVPQVIGQTAQAETRKSTGSRSSRTWDEEAFIEDLGQRAGEGAVRFAHRVFAWVKTSQRIPRWGKGMGNGCLIPKHPEHNGRPIALWSGGELEFRFNMLKRQPPFNEPSVRKEAVRRVLSIPNVEIEAAGSHDKSPNVLMSQLDSEDSWRGLMSYIDWLDETIQGHV